MEDAYDAANYFGQEAGADFAAGFSELQSEDDKMAAVDGFFDGFFAMLEAEAPAAMEYILEMGGSISVFSTAQSR